MLGLLPLAFVAGVLTVAAPCIIPVLPGILGGSLGTHKWRPLAVVSGLIASFTVFGTGFAIVLDVFGLSKGSLRIISVVLLFLFGLALAVPTFWEWVVMKIALVWRKIHNPSQPPSPRFAGEAGLTFRGGESQRGSFWSAFGVGATLGAVWTTCAGPILGVILTFAANTQDILRSGLLVFTYALGTGLPLLLIGYGTRTLVQRIKQSALHLDMLRRIAGAVLMLWSVAILFKWDLLLQAELVKFLPEPKL